MAVAAILLLTSAGYAFAQRGRSMFGAVRMAPPDMPDRNFTECRIMYTSTRSELWGAGWRTDYPLGEHNLMIRFSELTRTRISRDELQQPNQWVVRLTDPQLFNCLYTVASDVGTMGLSELEIKNFREYLLKGGFLWVDDFWGEAAWDQWRQVITEVLPGREIENVSLNDPIFRSQFIVKKMPQVPRYPFWKDSGGQTSERGEETKEPHFRAIRDGNGRIIVVMTHNTDMGDSWEREGEEPGYFRTFSIDGYALGVDVLLYAMTH
jgi:hypothetical protein